MSYRKESTALLTFILAATMAACSQSAAEPPAAGPEPAAEPPATETPDAPPADPAAGDVETSDPAAEPSAVVEPPPEPEVPRDPEAAAALVEEGREIQQTRGEGGAEDAIAKYQAALEKDPQAGAAYWELGWSYQVLDRWNEAVQAWDTLRELQPDYPEMEQHYPVAVMRRDQAAALEALPSPDALAEPETSPRAGPTLTFRAAGDIHMGYAWPEKRAKLPPNNGKDLFRHVMDLLANADVTFGNLETVLSDDGPSTKCGPKSTKCFSFRVPKAFAEAVKEAGFDVVSIANNHTGDFGQYGRAQTIEALDQWGLHHSGPIGDIASMEVKGLKIALIAFSTGGGVYQVQKIDMAKRVVAAADKTHDLVVVSFHGGAEGSGAAHVPEGVEMFLGENRGDLRTFTHTVVDAGADLVFGHGPHRFRGMEVYKGRFIAYSLGNFSTWDTFSLRGPLGLTGILEVTVAPNGVATSAELFPLIIQKPGRPKPDPKGRVLDIVRTLSRQDFGAPLFDKRGRWQGPLPPNS